MPDHDADEPVTAGPAHGAVHAPADPLGLFIAYVDAKGARSERRITARQLSGEPPRLLLLAFCHERKAMRSFRFDRIVEAVCAETGEVYLAAKLLEALAGEGLAPIPHRLRRAVNVLVFLMRCDGHAHPAEWAAIDDALARYMLRFGGGEADHARAMDYAREIAPDCNDFLIAMRSFTHDPEVAQLGRWLDQALAGIIDADGTQSAEEFAWMTEACDFIATMAGRARG
ncbi:MAG: hypothetical protein ABIR02_08230 [Novosphingobium sp.]